ncbi:hypothetical protein AX16_000826 [Volvariella volvacea WC 439]|nr:hypothetical protein AX16_000826 [Volvariella volvacea WC 439]
MAPRGVHSIERQWGLWSSLAHPTTAATLSLKNSVMTMVARLGHQLKTCVENKLRPGHPLQGDLPLIYQQELAEGSPRVKDGPNFVGSGMTLPQLTCSGLIGGVM